MAARFRRETPVNDIVKVVFRGPVAPSIADCCQRKRCVGRFVRAGTAFSPHAAVEIDNVGVAEIGIDQIASGHVGDRDIG